MAARTDLRTWVQKATTAEFADRIDAESGFLDSCDPGSDAFRVLHHAAALGRNDLVRMILDRGISIDMPSGTSEECGDAEAERPRFEPGYTALMCAAAHGQLATARYLILAGADPFKTDYHGGTALHSAAADGSVAIVNVLLGAGCDPEAECGYKDNCEELGFYWIGTPLHIAARTNNDAAARALIGHGAGVDARVMDERRPLHYAAAMGATRAVEVLLRADADPSRGEAHGCTPLHAAAREGHVECVALLLRYGADPNARLAETGSTALELARNFWIPERAEAACQLLRSAVRSRDV